MILCCMKKVIYVLVFFLLQLFLQPVSAENVAKDDVTAPMTKSVIKKFYKKLFRGENLQSLELGPSEVKNILSMKAAITQGYDWDVVCQVIDKAKAYTDGEWMDTIVALSFPNGNTVYHQLTGGSYWNHLWLPDGNCVFTLSSTPIQYMRIAMINDPDGYVNIREKPNAHSKIVRKIKKNELFYFTPISRAEWYPVSLKEISPCIGYIHKSRIKTFGDFPKKLQDKIRHWLSGC